jgi:general stress protein YciG
MKRKHSYSGGIGPFTECDICGDKTGKAKECKSVKSKAAQELGKKGGQKTASLYGKKHYSNAGKKGMRKRWKTYSS